MSLRFGTSGIRGIFGKNITTDMAFKLGVTIAKAFDNASKVVVGIDSRKTSPVLASALMSGLGAMGAEVYYAGLAPYPVVAFASGKLNGVGVLVTASHNPPEYNGFKIFVNGRELTSIQENMLQDYRKEPEPRFDRRLEPKYVDISDQVVDEYLEHLFSFVEPLEKEIRVIIDGSNGAAGVIATRALRELGAEVIDVNAQPDGFFPGRMPEPSEENLKDTMNIARSLGVPAMALDGDGDRLALIDPRGRFVDQSYTASLILEEVSKRRRGRRVVVLSVDTLDVAEEIAKKYGLKVYRYKLGYLPDIVYSMINDVLMATEPWKHMIPSYGARYDGILSACILAKVVEEGLEDRLSRLPKYYGIRRTYHIDPSRIDIVYMRLMHQLLERSHKYKRKKDLIDGIKVLGDGERILVRKSGTELGKLRIYIQARSKERAEEFKRKLEEIIKEAKRCFFVPIKKNGTIRVRYLVETTPDNRGKLYEIASHLADEQSLSIAGVTDVIFSVLGIDKEDIKKYGAVVRHVDPIGSKVVSDHNGGESIVDIGIVEIEYPTVHLSKDISFDDILVYIAGDLLDSASVRSIKITSIEFPENILKRFGGPLRSDYLRKIRGPGPYLGFIMKPSLGLTSDQYAKLARDVAEAGVHMIADDEKLLDPKYSKRIDRAKRILNEIKKSKNEYVFYFLNIGSRDPKRTLSTVLKALEKLDVERLGVLIPSMYASYDEINEVVREFDVPVYTRNSGFSALIDSPRGFNAAVLALFERISGADIAQIPPPVGSHKKDLYTVRSAYNALAGEGPIGKTIPLIGSGITPSLAYDAINMGFRDVIYLVGRAIVGHPKGIKAGVKAMLDAFKGALDGHTKEEIARESEEFRVALEKRGLESEISLSELERELTRLGYIRRDRI